MASAQSTVAAPVAVPLGIGRQRSNMAPRFFTGRESWVFRADAIDQLCGHHAELIGEAVTVPERVDYLVYSPRRDAGLGPFGLRLRSGSHALAVTESRLIVSRDAHQPEHPPTIRAVPFADVLAVELGEALTLGWLVVRFNDGGQTASETIVFQSSGIEHFRAALRAWRQRAAPGTTGNPSRDAWQSLFTSSPAYLRSQIAPVVLDGERLDAALLGAETWSAPSRRRRTCVTAPAACVVTNRGLLMAQSEPPYEPGALVFAVNVACVDLRAIRSASARAVDEHGRPVATLVLDTQAGMATHRIVVPLGGRSVEDLETAIEHVMRTEVACRRRSSDAHESSDT